MMVTTQANTLFSMLSRYMGFTSGFAISDLVSIGDLRPTPSYGSPGTVLKLRHYRGKNGFTPLTREEADSVRKELIAEFPQEGILCNNLRTGAQVRVYRSGCFAGLGQLAFEQESQPLGALVTHGNGRQSLSRPISREEVAELEPVG